MSSKTFPSIAVIIEGGSCFGKVVISNKERLVIVATRMKFLDQWAYLSMAVKNKKKTHLIAQISVEVMCKILFR